MKMYLFVGAFILLLGVPAFAATPTIVLGIPTVSGTTVTIPVTLTNVVGRLISGIDAHLYFNNISSTLALKTSGGNIVSAFLGAAAIAAGKQLTQVSLLDGDLHLAIYGLGTTAIRDGIVAFIAFDIVGPVTTGNESFKLYPTATDSTGTTVSVNLNSIVLVPGASTLTVSVSANGTVNSLPTGIACGASGVCSANFYTNSVVTLLPASSFNYDLSAWSGDCTGHGVCAPIMSVNRSVVATYLLNNHVQIAGNAGFDYGTLNNANLNALNKSVIMASEYSFTENLTLNKGLALTLAGGYNMWFDSRIGETIMNGKLTISSGSLVVDRLVVH